MARKGISKEMVVKAINEIESEGKTPTTKNIREILETGSMSTISKYLNEYQSSEQVAPDLQFNIKEALSVIGEETISQFLSNEHPQIVAVILSQLDVEATARILKFYSGDKAHDIIERIEKLEPIQQKIMSSIDKVLRDEMKAYAQASELVAGGSRFAEEVRASLRGIK